MNRVVLILIAIVLFIAAYNLYGKWLQKTWGIDPNAKTPAELKADGEDYVPSPWYLVFSHQFSSITGAGPVTGPIIAAMFGWLPAFLWIVFGGIFFGAVHDFGAMYASVKNDGQSIGVIIEKYVGKTGKKMFLLFSWIFSLLVIAAFSDIVATTFNGFISNDSGEVIKASASAAAASISMIFIASAIIFGLITKFLKPSAKIEFLLGIVLVIVTFLLGVKFPIYATSQTWVLIVFAYIFLAAVLPMWILMQPRDFLNTFMLLGMVVAAVIGVLVEHPQMELNAFNGFTIESGGVTKFLFPTLFITIACGAVSGFHSLVSSGTSSKQVRNERDMLPISFGAMLVECVLAVVALVVAGSAAVNGQLPEGTPFQIFSGSVGGFLTNFGIPQNIAQAFMTMCISALALTTLDSVARIGRVALQEFFIDEQKTASSLVDFITNKYVATLITLILGYLLSKGGYNNVWALFGSANQLLAALVTIALAVFLKSTNRKGWMLYIPMTFMLLCTGTSLIQALIGIIRKIGTPNFVLLVDGLQLIVACLLFALGFIVAINCFKELSKQKENITIFSKR